MTRGALGLKLLMASSGVDAGIHPEFHFVAKPFPPYVLESDSGRPAGPMVDLLQVACARLGWVCAVDLMPWRRAYRAAEQGTVDGLFPVADTPERHASFCLTPPVVRARYVLLAAPGRTLDLSPDLHELAGRTVATYGPSDAATVLGQLLAGIPDTRLEVERDDQNVLHKLVAGRYGEAGLVLMNEAVAQQLQSSLPHGAPMKSRPIKSFDYAIALTPQRVSLADSMALSQAIHALCKGGIAREIFRRHGLIASQCTAVHPRSQRKGSRSTEHENRHQRPQPIGRTLSCHTAK